MNQAMTPAAYMRKSDQALSSAHQLLAAGDADGACNRAYYAMFDAAQAALLATNVDAHIAAGRTIRPAIVRDAGASVQRGVEPTAGPARGAPVRQGGDHKPPERSRSR